MIDSNLKIIGFIMIFFIGLGCMVADTGIYQPKELIVIYVLYLLPFFSIIMLTANRKKWAINKKIFITESLSVAMLFSLLVSLFVPTLNRILPPSVDYLIDGKVLEIHPGKGATHWYIKINQKNGQIVDLSVPRPKFPEITVNDNFTLKVKRGGLGLLYGPRN